MWPNASICKRAHVRVSSPLRLVPNHSSLMQPEMERGGEEPAAAMAAFRREEATPPIWRTEPDDGSWVGKQMEPIHSSLQDPQKDAFY